MMTYKGYTGKVIFDDEAGILFGTVNDIRDVITFHGASVDEVRQAFHDSVDAYLTFCAELGDAPEKPYSGKILYRTAPSRHRQIAHAARLAGLSVNAWIDQALAQALTESGPAGRAVVEPLPKATRRSGKQAG
ncbi:MAG: type II toxin-antitoxin system HicB family antitoxin [Chloroflexota bacterium]